MKKIQMLPTQFAPAERVSVEEIKRSKSIVSVSKYIKFLLDSVPNAFLILNEHRQIVFANEMFVTMIGAESADEIIGCRFGEILDCEHAHDTPGGCGTTEFCRTCGAAQTQVKGLSGNISTEECRINTVKGEALDLSVSARPIDFNKKRYLVFTTRDIADEKRREALEHTFFHDILNTAGILSMYAQILEIDPTEISNTDLDLGQITTRLIDEIRSQQELLQAEQDNLKIKVDTINAGVFIKDLVKQYRSHPVATDRQITMYPNLPDINITVDPVLLGRILSNMIKNALEAIPTGEDILVGFDIDSDNNTIRFVVHNGSFIPPRIQNQIFQRSFSTKGAGRGLGTYSMKLLGEQHLGGKVSFESTKDNGTTFYMTLPL